MNRVLTAGLVMAMALTGCLGSVTPAGISQQTLDQNGWTLTDSSGQSAAAGLVEIQSRTYEPNGSPASVLGVQVVSVTNIPILDESRFIPQAIEQVEQQNGVEFEEIGPKALDFTNPAIGTQSGTEYRINGAGAPAKATVVPVPCESFVIVVAFGPTDEAGGNVFGGGVVPYQQALKVARGAQCTT